ncbi:lytic murein transglycosylase B [Marinobacterium arenosum]|uniref:lytic murein transglycosylase B n=1 Tax=Marinobacterium arenosum TaxID=2862496 RepID=UPI001C986969|nr:lytic murein transglycosylase B [Marinobacterium arenosum]MBY4676209.1 lytic murein transglycosylase B [Marinobacterium arenosum]
MRTLIRSMLATATLAGAMIQTGCAATERGHEQNYARHPQAQPLIAELSQQGFEESYLKSVLGQAKRQESILEVMARPAERRLTWGEYRKIFLGQTRIDQGVAFWRQHADTLARAEQTYGVPAEIIVAIIGVETRYGRIMGNYRVLDALATLGFDYPKRGEFFRGQLKEYLMMAREESIEDLTALKGSYAGAMGFGQFIPSSYRNFAVDFDGDGKRDIWNNPVDAIGSVANYFKQHGWQSGEPVRAPVVFNQPVQDDWVNQGLKPQLSLQQWAERGVGTDQTLDPTQPATLMRMQSGEQYRYWLGLHNFYVITRYNHSRLYASAVYELSREVKAAREKVSS